MLGSTPAGPATGAAARVPRRGLAGRDLAARDAARRFPAAPVVVLRGFETRGADFRGFALPADDRAAPVEVAAAGAGFFLAVVRGRREAVRFGAADVALPLALRGRFVLRLAMTHPVVLTELR